VHLGWGTTPTIDLDMEFRVPEVTVHFRLGLSTTTATVHINYIAFAEPDTDPDVNTARLLAAIEGARLRHAPRA